MAAMLATRNLARWFFLLGCALAVRAETMTLAGNQRLPADDIREFISPPDWAYLCSRRISRFVALRAEIRSDTTVRPGRVFRAYPDAAWNDIARQFAARALLNYSPTIGSQLSPQADVYVVFFEPEPSGDGFVLVYAQEVGWIRRPSGGQRKFVGRPLAGKFENIVSLTGPQFLQTFAIEGRK